MTLIQSINSNAKFIHSLIQSASRANACAPPPPPPSLFWVSETRWAGLFLPTIRTRRWRKGFRALRFTGNRPKDAVTISSWGIWVVSSDDQSGFGIWISIWIWIWNLDLDLDVDLSLDLELEFGIGVWNWIWICEFEFESGFGVEL